jgi:hypothetical protein
MIPPIRAEGKVGVLRTVTFRLEILDRASLATRLGGLFQLAGRFKVRTPPWAPITETKFERRLNDHRLNIRADLGRLDSWPIVEEEVGLVQKLQGAPWHGKDKPASIYVPATSLVLVKEDELQPGLAIMLLLTKGNQAVLDPYLAAGLTKSLGDAMRSASFHHPERKLHKVHYAHDIETVCLHSPLSTLPSRLPAQT